MARPESESDIWHDAKDYFLYMFTELIEAMSFLYNLLDSILVSHDWPKLAQSLEDVENFLVMAKIYAMCKSWKCWVDSIEKG